MYRWPLLIKLPLSDDGKKRETNSLRKHFWWWHLNYFASSCQGKVPRGQSLGSEQTNMALGDTVVWRGCCLHRGALIQHSQMMWKRMELNNQEIYIWDKVFIFNFASATVVFSLIYSNMFLLNLNFLWRQQNLDVGDSTWIVLFTRAARLGLKLMSQYF